MSVIHANSSISVIPGSDTLCSVHSGHSWAIFVDRLGDDVLEAAVVELDVGELQALTPHGIR